MSSELEVLRAIRESNEKELKEEYYKLASGNLDLEGERYNRWIERLSNTDFDVEFLATQLIHLGLDKGARAIEDLFAKTDKYTNRDDFEKALKDIILRHLYTHLSSMQDVLEQFKILQRICKMELMNL